MVLTSQNNTFEKLFQSGIPFKRTLSLRPLLENLEESLGHSKNSRGREFIQYLKNIPEFWQPIKDVSFFENHQEDLSVLMGHIIPWATRESEARAALYPMEFKAFYTTPALDRLLDIENLEQCIEGFEKTDFDYKKTMYGYTEVLSRVYGVTFSNKEPMVFNIPDNNTGLSRYYQIMFNSEYVDMRYEGGWPKLDAEEVKHLRDNIFDLDLLTQTIDPRKIEFCGFIFISFVDITEQRVISDLKNTLLEKDVLNRDDLFWEIQNKVQILFGQNELQIRLSALDDNFNAIDTKGSQIWNSFLSRQDDSFSCSVFKGCVYEKAMNGNKTLIISDLSEQPNRTEVENRLLEQGIRSLLISPLVYDGEEVGLMEVFAPQANVLDFFAVSKFETLAPLFSLAVHRSLEDTNNRIEAIMQKEFTAIHPVVAWRFREVAAKIKKQKERGEAEEVEPIIFKDIYPVFGQSDIRGSSTIRNESIQADLIEQLELIDNIIRSALKKKYIPVLEELSFRVNRNIKDIRLGLNAGDEVTNLDFIKHEIEPLYNLVQESGPETRSAIQKYWEALDPELGFVYKKRKAFERSLTRINEMISEILDQKEAQAQEMFPHYFEKYKTDGVEHNMYVGNALTKRNDFQPIHLKNLRLWQLQTMVEVARKSKALVQDLEVPLETTHLILVHSAPLAIRFREEEKQFDVDGAYNIRYEIVKKRIDKAYIKNTNERLTQPNKIAIVYSRDNEVKQYQQFVEFLAHKNLVYPEIEYLELEELQGASGLKAIRVKVKEIQNQGNWSKNYLKDLDRKIIEH